MKKLLLLVAFGLLSQFGHAQNQHLIDSLKSTLILAKDGDRFAILNAIAWEYRFAYPDSTLIYSQRAYDYGKTLGLQENLAVPLNYMGIAHNYLGNRIASLEYHQKAIDLARKQSDSSSIAHAYNSIGRVYFEQGMMQQSVEYWKFLKAFRI